MTNPTNENLGPAERIIRALTTHSDHLYHGRPGMVEVDPSAPHGVKWVPGSVQKEEGQNVFYLHNKVSGRGGKSRTHRSKVGLVLGDGSIRDDGRHKLGRFQKPGILPEVAVWMYSQVAEVWKIDNEFAAKWASFAFRREDTPRDLLVILAAFMLVQSRFGEPVLGANGKAEFLDEDYREIGEAMCLIYGRRLKGLDAKQILRVLRVLKVPGVVEINRELGFGRSARRPPLGRWSKTAERWLRYRELNPSLLDGLLKAGNRSNVIRLCQHVGYKPVSPRFFEVLRWQQTQCDEGHREFIDTAVLKTETWESLSEADICSKIVQERIGFKQAVGRLPKSVGLTRAVMAALVESGGLSNKDLVANTPTLESLGLLEVQSIKERWDRALQAASDQRALHVAQRVSNKRTREQLETAADNAVTKAVEKEVRGLRVYVAIDRSASMDHAIEIAKDRITQILGGFPLDHLHVCVFNSIAKIVPIRSSSRAGITNAFRGVRSGGGTDYGAAVREFASAGLLPKENEDALIIFVGDEEQLRSFQEAVTGSGINPSAFGLVRLYGGHVHQNQRDAHYQRFNIVRDTARSLGIPCFEVTESTFNDAYAVPRILRDLIASTPVNYGNRGVSQRKPLVDQILETDLLEKPAWAYAQG